MHGRSGEFSPVDVVIWYLFIKFLVKKCLSLSFELMKSNFTNVGPLENLFRPLHEKIHCIPNPWKNPSDAHAWVCAIIIILRLSRLYQCNVNNCCKWGIISFHWTFPSKNPVYAKILLWMVLLPPLGVTLNAWFTTNGRGAKNCTHM